MIESLGHSRKGLAYVANLSSDNVSVIETSDNTVTATIPVGDRPFGIAIAPAGNFAYVTNFGSDTVSVIATTSNTVTATIAVGFQPYGVAITP